MHINFAMWRKASWQLIKMDDKKEWDALDVVSKWLIATRSAVTLVTVYSCVIAGLLAWRDGNFSWLPFIILTLGLFIAHGTNNILNDYTDYSRGVDKDNYFRTKYGVHPLVQGFFTKPQQIRWFLVSGVLATLAGIYALITTGFDPCGDRPVRVWRRHAAGLYLSLQILGSRRTGHLPDLGTDPDRRRLLRPGSHQRRGHEQHLECRSGRYSLWPGRCQHQYRQAY